MFRIQQRPIAQKMRIPWRRTAWMCGTGEDAKLCFIRKELSWSSTCGQLVFHERNFRTSVTVAATHFFGLLAYRRPNEKSHIPSPRCLRLGKWLWVRVHSCKTLMQRYMWPSRSPVGRRRWVFRNQLLSISKSFSKRLVMDHGISILLLLTRTNSK